MAAGVELGRLLLRALWAQPRAPAALPAPAAPPGLGNPRRADGRRAGAAAAARAAAAGLLLVAAPAVRAEPVAELRSVPAQQQELAAGGADKGEGTVGVGVPLGEEDLVLIARPVPSVMCEGLLRAPSGERRRQRCGRGRRRGAAALELRDEVRKRRYQHPPALEDARDTAVDRVDDEAAWGQRQAPSVDQVVLHRHVVFDAHAGSQGAVHVAAHARGGGCEVLGAETRTQMRNAEVGLRAKNGNRVGQVRVGERPEATHGGPDEQHSPVVLRDLLQVGFDAELPCWGVRVPLSIGLAQREDVEVREGLTFTCSADVGTLQAGLLRHLALRAARAQPHGGRRTGRSLLEVLIRRVAPDLLVQLLKVLDTLAADPPVLLPQELAQDAEPLRLPLARREGYHEHVAPVHRLLASERLHARRAAELRGGRQLAVEPAPRQHPPRRNTGGERWRLWRAVLAHLHIVALYLGSVQADDAHVPGDVFEQVRHRRARERVRLGKQPL
mmetsp:Transcript_53408/g.155712  ORF Transcript_53408/g.155712 Transcript_53408/m.155712 type:complete len:500 (-) Transcript_53408:798-2297(-)